MHMPLYLLLHRQVGALSDIIKRSAALEVPALSHDVAAAPHAGKQLLRLQAAPLFSAFTVSRIPSKVRS